MPDPAAAAERVRRLAEFLAQGDATSVSVSREGESIAVRRARRIEAIASAGIPEPKPAHVDAIAADIVGIFRLGRPAPVEGQVLDGDRELGYVEALGIRNPVHSLGGGRIVAVAAADGTPVEYGQPLFLVDRG